ncbi:MAG: hypothetical protein PHI76_00795 [Clostridia bacterium]|nr:hypothetical protein [Clostridia bacterium]
MIVQIGGEFLELSAGKTLEIEESTYISVFPTSKSFLPFCFIAEKQSVFRNDYLNIFEYPNFLMLEACPPISFSPVFLKGKMFKDFTVCLIGSPFKFLVDIEVKHFSFDCKDNIKNIDFYENKNAIIMQADFEDSDYVVLFHKGNKKFYELVGNFSIEEDGIILIEDKKTFARHGELQTFIIKEDKLEKVSSEPIYLNGSPSRFAPFLNHIAFFQAVKEKDYFLAKKLLSKKFAQNISDELFEQFFGEFDEVKPIMLDGQNKIALLKKTTARHWQARVFKISTISNLITDIVEE